MPYHDITTCHDIYQHIVAALLVIMPTLRLTRDQTIQINEYGIKVAYMGSVSKYQSDMIADSCWQYKCEHFEVSAKTLVENVMSLLITMVKIMMTMVTEHNSPTNVIHLHNLNPNADQTHADQIHADP